MGSRVVAALVVATAVLVTAGCNNDSAEPSTPPTVRFTFGESTASALGTAPAGSGRPTGLASSSNPWWPAGLTPDQIDAAEAALTAYQAYWSVMDSIAGHPAADWTAQVGDVATAEAGDDMLTMAQELVAAGQHAIGPTTVNPTVTSVDGGIVTIRACVDTTAADVVDSTQVSVRPPDQPGSLWRYISTAQVAVFEGGQWLVAVDAADRSTSC